MSIRIDMRISLFLLYLLKIHTNPINDHLIIILKLGQYPNLAIILK